jgi:regulator of sigma E protease
MTIAIAIIGLGLLILVHEAGHFFASLAVGLRPRRFYVGLPPAIVKAKRRGIEYGIGAIPLGGFVTIPGMHRPIPHDAERRLTHVVSEAPALAGPFDRVRRGLDAEDLDAALPAVDEFEQALNARIAADEEARDARTVVDGPEEESSLRTISPHARRQAEKGLTELRDGLGPDAYWKAPTWKRLVAIAAGPGANVVLAIILLAGLFMTSAGAGLLEEDRVVPVVGAVSADSPAETVGLQPGDRILVVDGARIEKAEDIPGRISASGGREIIVVVRRDGQKVTLGPIAAEQVDGAYRLGFSLDVVSPPAVALGPVDALGESLRVTGLVTTEIVKSLGRLATGEGREEIASPIGITQVSSDAAERGAEYYVMVLALISLSLALLNLLPLLPLDGGHILFALLEGARGRIVRREVYERVSVIGLAVVALLFFIGISNDIGRLS